MKIEGARRLRPGDLVWWRHKGVKHGVVLALFHRDGLLLRVHIEARHGHPAKRYLSFRRIYYQAPAGEQLEITGAREATGRLDRLAMPPQRPPAMPGPNGEQLPLERP
jgi:hypothetical protein